MQDHENTTFPALPSYSEDERIARSTAFYEAIRTRRSCRHFADTAVPRAVIENALRAAGTAPSGANHQPWHFAVIGSAENKRALREAAEDEERSFYGERAGSQWLEALAPLGTDAEKPYLETAPWLIAIFGQRRGGVQPRDDLQNYYITESVGIATGMLITALHDAGLATLTHTPNPMKFLNKLCQRPETEKPILLLVTGHPAKDATVPVHAVSKKPLEQISSWH